MDAGQGIGAGGFRLESYRAEEAALVDPAGTAFSSAMGGINGARTYVAAMCAGMLAAAIDLALGYGLSRRAFGQPLAELQGWRWSLVHAETDLAALRLLTYRAARRVDAGEPADEDAARAKKFAGDRTLAHLSACIQAMGANGLRGASAVASPGGRKDRLFYRRYHRDDERAAGEAARGATRSVSRERGVTRAIDKVTADSHRIMLAA